MRNYYLLFFISLGFYAPVWAWDHITYEGVKKLDEKLDWSSPFFDRFEFSLWGSVKARLYDPSPQYISLRNSYLQKPVRAAYQISQPQLAELYVYIPGIFNNVDEGQSSRAFVRMQNLSGNVLVLPNPWGTDYLKAKAWHKPGDLIREAESTYALIEDFLRRAKMPASTRINLFGASYGAFLAAIVANLDRSLGKNRINERVYLFSPPLHMGRTIRNIDQLMWEDDFFNRKITDKELAFIFLDYIFANSDKDLDTSSKILSRPLTIRIGFKDPFREALAIYFAKDAAYDKQQKYLFRSYLESLAPELEGLLKSEVANLDYWVSGGKQNYQLDIKVLSTTNDFLNTFIVSGIYPSDQYWFFRSGGHLGFIQLDEFEVFLQQTKQYR